MTDLDNLSKVGSQPAAPVKKKSGAERPEGQPLDFSAGIGLGYLHAPTGSNGPAVRLSIKADFRLIDGFSAFFELGFGGNSLGSAAENSHGFLLSGTAGLGHSWLLGYERADEEDVDFKYEAVWCSAYLGVNSTYASSPELNGRTFSGLVAGGEIGARRTRLFLEYSLLKNGLPGSAHQLMSGAKIYF